MKSKIGVLTAMAALFGGMTGGAENSNTLRPSDIDTTPKKKPVPKGCKEYFFFDNGSYTDHAHDQCVFNCIAMTDKKAREKFNKYRSKE